LLVYACLPSSLPACFCMPAYLPCPPLFLHACSCLPLPACFCLPAFASKLLSVSLCLPVLNYMPASFACLSCCFVPMPPISACQPPACLPASVALPLFFFCLSVPPYTCLTDCLYAYLPACLFLHSCLPLDCFCMPACICFSLCDSTCLPTCPCVGVCLSCLCA
jgi:hypothetical protein